MAGGGTEEASCLQDSLRGGWGTTNSGSGVDGGQLAHSVALPTNPAWTQPQGCGGTSSIGSAQDDQWDDFPSSRPLRSRRGVNVPSRQTSRPCGFGSTVGCRVWGPSPAQSLCRLSAPFPGQRGNHKGLAHFPSRDHRWGQVSSCPGHSGLGAAKQEWQGPWQLRKEGPGGAPGGTG